MTTERLFHGPPLRTDADARFSAALVSVREHEQGAAVELDRTQFYPHSGGQPCDLGTLNALPVVDVLEAGERVIHVVGDASAASWTAGQSVTGHVDLARRSDHMQQHSGQHLLSALLLAQFGIETLSFHLGAEVSTIDVRADQLERARVAEVEAAVNDAIRAAHPVTATVYEGDAIATALAGLRKPPAGEALASPLGLRIVQFGQGATPIDRDACCGTHVASTGQLGSLVVLGTERGRKGETRISFAVGGRATRAVRARLDALQSAGSTLTSGFADLAERGQKLLDQVKALSRDLRQARAELTEHEAKALAEGAHGALVHLLEGDDPKAVGGFARACVAANPQLLVAVIHAGERLSLAIAKGEAAPPIHAGNLVRELLTPLGGKGGGAPHSAQGAAPDPQRAEELRQAAEAALSQS